MSDRANWIVSATKKGLYTPLLVVGKTCSTENSHLLVAVQSFHPPGYREQLHSEAVFRQPNKLRQSIACKYGIICDPAHPRIILALLHSGCVLTLAHINTERRCRLSALQMAFIQRGCCFQPNTDPPTRQTRLQLLLNGSRN